MDEPIQPRQPENVVNAQSADKKNENIEENNNNKTKRNGILLKVFLVLILLSILTFLYWYFFIRFHETTNDAYVNGNNVNLMAPQNGITVSIYADNTDFVKQGQLLVELDTTTYQLAFDKAQVDLALAARQVRQLWEDTKQRDADVLLREAELKRAHQDFENRNALRNTQAISKEDLTHAQADLEVARAALHSAQHQQESAQASLGSTPIEEHPLIRNAEIALREAYVNLQRCEILAPVSGYVAQRNVQVGEWVTPTRALLSIIPLDEIWIDANFKETELSDIRIDQPVSIVSDLYGSDVVYHGKVVGMQAGTGSVFSLIPPQNATGNWIKIVQRVPVRISLDKQELQQHPLVLGLSVHVNVDTSDQSGLQLAEKPLYSPRFITPVFDITMQPVDQLIQSIIQQNLHSTGNSTGKGTP
ncbi:HlyD family efflux transporter periplasmic adaptor subunit [Candidatus Protochlamydia phocaeensis]|uniref:HlyD family secretion protein n=1 Tax=Candidatus Protochlamydia phocaeensis TaxID=1414722 RepID=UPI0008397183|nr:HlyD family efflux transporter periplasmic adaptor subunit [Candidatus Protochlamydia phocaeensis]